MDAHEQPIGRVAVVIPTYNERANIEATAGRVRRAVPDADLLVVDDNSPDGTGEIADKLAAEDSHIHVLHRDREGGPRRRLHRGLPLGAGPRATACWSRWTPTVRTSRRNCPRLLDALAGADLVLGSRWVAGGTVRNWPKSRELLSRGGNTYARLMLGIGLKDATGGYRAYRASHAARDRARRGGVPGVLLPDRPGHAGDPGRAPGRGGADHVRRTGARHSQDEPGDRRARRSGGSPSGASPAAAAGSGPPARLTPPGQLQGMAAPGTSMRMRAAC